MSKNRKSRRKSRNRKSAAKAEPSAPRVDNASVDISTVSTCLLLQSRHGSDKVNKQELNFCDKIKSSIDSSEKKRKDFHTLTNESSLHVSDPATNRKRNKRRRTTHEPSQNQNDSKSMDSSAGKKDGALIPLYVLCRFV
jgi:hypothetical protein